MCWSAFCMGVRGSECVKFGLWCALGVRVAMIPRVDTYIIMNWKLWSKPPAQ